MEDIKLALNIFAGIVFLAVLITINLMGIVGIINLIK